MTKIKTAELSEVVAAFFPGRKGVLVLDRYAEADARSARPRPVDVVQFLNMALTAPALEEVVSTVLLTLDGLMSTTQLRGTTGFARHIQVGVCMDPASATGDLLARVRTAGAVAVELRANLGPTVAEPGKPAVEALALARKARLVQEIGLVPILTFAMPDLGTQSLNVTYAVTANALRGLVTACESLDVELADVVIRTSMVSPGSAVRNAAEPQEVGSSTIAALRETLPSSVGGVLLLSGGQDLQTASSNLSATMAAAAQRAVPWPLTHAFARPLIQSALRRWDGTAGSPVARMAVTSACRVAADALQPGAVK